LRLYSSILHNHQYTVLPAFSKFLLENHLDELVEEQIKLSYEIKLPLLQHLQHFSHEQLIEFSKISQTELLTYLADNKGRQLIEEGLKKWIQDQLEIVGKFDLQAEDITLLNFIRGKSFRQFIPLFTSDVKCAIQLIDELDHFLLDSTTAATNTYMFLLKDEIAKHESELLEAQSIAHIGSFEWDIEKQESSNSPEVYNIMEVKHGMGFDNFINNVDPDDRESVRTSITNAFEKGTFDTEFKYKIHGKTKYLWAKGMIVKDKHDKATKLIGTLQDITSRKKTENELLLKTIELERSNANLEEFAYAASHDLQEPIRKIHLFSDRLQQKLLDRIDFDDRHLFERLQKAAERMQLLINDLLEYSHVSIQPREQEEIDLNDKVNKVIDDLEINIKEKDAVIEVDQLPTVKGYRRQLQQLFHNLIGNAVKYSKAGIAPHVHIFSRQVHGKDIDLELPESERSKNFYEIIVKDNGIGFEKEYSEKIFQIFHRLHGKAEYSGTGLGLSIVKRVIENHKGYITVESQPGEGSVFKVYLPV
jgi:signal transduction histidine kinase